MGLFDGLLDVFTGQSAKDAAAKNAALYQDYGTQANSILGQALPQETSAINQGISAYAPLASLGSQYNQAGTMLGNALGLNGAAGNAAATAAFQSAPGYQFALNQGVDQAVRAANATGTATGNIIQGATDYATNYANQNYNNYLSNLGGLAGMGLSATGQAAGGQQSGYNALAGTYGQNASDRIGVAGNVASGTANSNTQAANSEMQASGNFWNGLLSLGGNLAKGYWSGGKAA